MSYLFTSESVSEGHPDKIADQISDAILDQFMALDPDSKVACETLVTTGQVILAGEVKSSAYIDIQTTARETIRKIGYTKSEYAFDADSCGIMSSIHEQSPDINRGVDKDNKENQGAGDQGLMFGYACNETPNYMPLPIDMAHSMLKELANIRQNEIHLMPYLRPDAKSQITIEYDDNGSPKRIDTIVISTQHDEFIKPNKENGLSQIEADNQMREKIQEDIQNILIPRVMKYYGENVSNLFNDDIKLFVNPTGKFVIGGPHGDTGLTGRKIIVDTYGGMASHGGGAFSGKDPSKVDRSAAYVARYIAKNLVASGLCDKVVVQLSYAIGIAEPINIYINTQGSAKINISDKEIADKIPQIFDLRPYAIEKKLKLRNPIYQETASYGHFGRTPQIVKKQFQVMNNDVIEKEVELFTWEKLDCVNQIKQVFNL